jgi:hypothetical protein
LKKPDEQLCLGFQVLFKSFHELQRNLLGLAGSRGNRLLENGRITSTRPPAAKHNSDQQKHQRNHERFLLCGPISTLGTIARAGFLEIAILASRAQQTTAPNSAGDVPVFTDIATRIFATTMIKRCLFVHDGLLLPHNAIGRRQCTTFSLGRWKQSVPPEILLETQLSVGAIESVL